MELKHARKGDFRRHRARDSRTVAAIHEHELLRRIFHVRKNLLGGAHDNELNRVLETTRCRFVERLLRRHAHVARVEKEFWETSYRYELYRTEFAGHTCRCSATRQKISRLGMVPAAIETVLETRLPQGPQALVGHDLPNHDFKTVIIHSAGCFGAFLMSFAWQSPALRPATEALAQAAAAPPAGPTVRVRPLLPGGSRAAAYFSVIISTCESDSPSEPGAFALNRKSRVNHVGL
jgi:hypothetical protein